MIRYRLVVAAVVVLLGGCLAPLMVQTFPNYEYYAPVTNHSYPLWGYSWPAALVMALSAWGIWAGWQGRSERLLNVAGTVGSVCAFVVAGLVVNEVSTPNAKYLFGLWIDSTFYDPRGFAWGFWVLLTAVPLGALAAWWPEVRESPVSTAPQPAHPTPPPRPVAPNTDYRAPGLPADVGLCAKCQAKNSRVASRCHACGEILPWALPKAPVKVPALPTLPPVAVKAGQKIQKFDWVALFLGFGSGTMIFFFCLLFFPVGIFFWRYLDEQDSRFVNLALAGWVLGMIFWLGRIALMIASVGIGTQ